MARIGRDPSSGVVTMASDFDTVPGKLATDHVAVHCLISEHEPDLCDGWCESYDIDPQGFRVDGYGRIYAPEGVPTECPECGDRLLAYNGVEVNFHA